MKKTDIDTPCLLIDLDIFDENLKKMQTIADSAGKKLRPHAKTHKCSTMAKRQIAAGAVGVCVAKISEAEALVEAGVEGVLITGALAVEQKIKRAVSLFHKSPSTVVVVDHPSNIDLLERHLSNSGLRMNVLVDIDVGSRRTGAFPEKALELADLVLGSDHLRLKGVQAYAGYVQHIHRYEERKKASLESLKPAAAVFRELRKKAETCTIFSGTGTGTSDIDLAIPELTELQVGSYALMDAEYGAIESARSALLSAAFGPALTLMATVVNVTHKTHVTIDAGLKTLYRDVVRPHVATPKYAGLRYDWFGDEYGKLSPGESSAPLPSLGETIELVVSHCDPTVNQFDSFYILQGDRLIDVWPIDLRGMSR